MTTDELLARVRELDKAATQWAPPKCEPGDYSYIDSIDGDPAAAFHALADAELAVFYRAAAPRLADEVERLAAELDQRNKDNAKLRNYEAVASARVVELDAEALDLLADRDTARAEVTRLRKALVAVRDGLRYDLRDVHDQYTVPGQPIEERRVTLESAAATSARLVAANMAAWQVAHRALAEVPQ